MAITPLNYGSAANDGTGDGLRDTFIKIESNTDELYKRTGYASYIDDVYTSVSPFTVSANTDTILPNRIMTKIDSQLPDDIECFYYAAELDLSGITGTFVKGETITGGTSGATAKILEVFTASNLRLEDYNGTFSTSEIITGVTSGATATIDTIGNGKITGRNGDALDIMIYFRAESSAVDQWMDIWVDIGGTVGEIYRDTKTFPKGASTERGVVYALPSSYTLGTWEANGGTVYVRSNASLDVYGINFNFDRSHKAR